MKIILIKEVQGFGHAGEIKEVKEGYAKNFLIPKGLAVSANKHSLKMINDQKNKQIRQTEKVKTKKQLLAKKLKNKTIEIKTTADETGTLYAGLDTKKISEELKKQGFSIESDEIKLKTPIKTLGEYNLTVKLAGENLSIKLAVKA